MSIEESIRYLTDSAAEQEAKLAKLEQNSALLDQALRRLAERQRLLEIWAAEVQKMLDDVQSRPFRRRHRVRRLKASYLCSANCRPASRPTDGVKKLR